MSSEEIRKKFLEFFKSLGHTIVPSSSLIPDDLSVLLTTAGMQQFKPYFTGKVDPMKDFGALRTASIQKCFRTSDIDEVGDESHLTFFEMLGHFSFGDYFKKETIEWTYELLTKVFGISKDRIRATVFKGDESVPFDEKSFETWSNLLPPKKVGKGSRSNNFWGPAGTEGPCGAANEVYVDDMEVATLVFMEYNCVADGTLTPLLKKGVDVGWGFERLAMIIQNKPTIFETDLFGFLSSNTPSGISDEAKRIIGDHARAIIFLVSDGVKPSNKGAGYILRRLMRRLMAHSDFPGLGSVKGFGDRYGLGVADAENLFKEIHSFYRSFYPELDPVAAISHYRTEYEKFGNALKIGIRELKKSKKIDAALAFMLYESYGIPFEVVKDFADEKTRDLSREDFEAEFKKHQEISRAGAEKKFGGHGLILDTGELKAGNEEELKKVLRLHTATHLLQQALREVLGKDMRQMGSDITPERTRFDFSFPRKLTPEEVKKVEDLVNERIKEDLPVNFVELSKEEAQRTGALYFFKEKYPEKVKVYYIGDDLESAWSKEFCGGPHVQHTGEIGQFKVVKEEAVGSGVRRIRGTVVE